MSAGSGIGRGASSNPALEIAGGRAVPVGQAAVVPGANAMSGLPWPTKPYTRPVHPPSSVGPLASTTSPPPVPMSEPPVPGEAPPLAPPEPAGAPPAPPVSADRANPSPPHAADVIATIADSARRREELIEKDYHP